MLLKTADGKPVNEGDRVFSHYSMKEGTIRDNGDTGPDPWVFLVYDNGGRDLLNGERLCSLAHAKRMGWL